MVLKNLLHFRIGHHGLNVRKKKSKEAEKVAQAEDKLKFIIVTLRV